MKKGDYPFIYLILFLLNFLQLCLPINLYWRWSFYTSGGIHFHHGVGLRIEHWRCFSSSLEWAYEAPFRACKKWFSFLWGHQEKLLDPNEERKKKIGNKHPKHAMERRLHLKNPVWNNVQFGFKTDGTATKQFRGYSYMAQKEHVKVLIHS